MVANNIELERQALWERYVSGDDKAFMGLFESFTPLIARALQNFVPPAEADEAVHIVEMKLASARYRFDPQRGGRLSTYVYGICRHVGQDYRRRMLRRQRCLQQLASRLHLTERRDFPCPLEKEEQISRLYAGLVLLDRTARNILVWHYVDGKSHTEIASTLGMTERACRKRCSRAKAELKAYLEAESNA